VHAVGCLSIQSVSHGCAKIELTEYRQQGQADENFIKLIITGDKTWERELHDVTRGSNIHNGSQDHRPKTTKRTIQQIHYEHRAHCFL